MLLTTLVVGETAPSTTLGTMIVVSGAFLILMLLLKKYAWGAIVDILTQREEKIANDLDSAEQSRVAAAKMEKERQQQLLSSRSEAAEIIKNAKESGEQTRQKTLKETTAEVTRLREKARTDISQEREEADLSLQIAAKILNKELTPDAHEALIDSYIESLGKANETR